MIHTGSLIVVYQTNKLIDLSFANCTKTRHE